MRANCELTKMASASALKEFAAFPPSLHHSLGASLQNSPLQHLQSAESTAAAAAVAASSLQQLQAIEPPLAYLPHLQALQQHQAIGVLPQMLQHHPTAAAPHPNLRAKEAFAGKIYFVYDER